MRGSDADGFDSMFQQCTGNVLRPQSIDVKSMICPSQIQEARQFIDGLHLAISINMNTEEGRVKRMTDNLSRCAQVRNFYFRFKFCFLYVQMMKTNPTFSYARVSQANIDEIPFNLKQDFEKFPKLSEGIICECRVQVGLKHI